MMSRCRWGQIGCGPEGSAGGHNGLKSIEAHLGTDKYARLRCGVDAVPPGWALEKWVLSRFDRQQEEALGEMIYTARLAIDCCQTEGIAVAMNRFNASIGPKTTSDQENEINE